jgi:hypothetical protein
MPIPHAVANAFRPAGDLRGMRFLTRKPDRVINIRTITVLIGKGSKAGSFALGSSRLYALASISKAINAMAVSSSISGKTIGVHEDFDSDVLREVRRSLIRPSYVN